MTDFTSRPAKAFRGGRVVNLSDNARYIARLEELVWERFKQRLPLLMERRKLNCPKLAAASRVSINTVYEHVHGRGRPSIGKLLAYAAALGVSVDALFAETAAERLGASGLTLDGLLSETAAEGIVQEARSMPEGNSPQVNTG